MLPYPLRLFTLLHMVPCINVIFIRHLQNYVWLCVTGQQCLSEWLITTFDIDHLCERPEAGAAMDNSNDSANRIAYSANRVVAHG